MARAAASAVEAGLNLFFAEFAKGVDRALNDPVLQAVPADWASMRTLTMSSARSRADVATHPIATGRSSRLTHSR
jgi:hypothetical protein